MLYTLTLHKRYLAVAVGTLVTIGSLQGCGEDEKTASEAASLTNTWVTACSAEDDGTYQQETTVFKDGDVTITSSNYMDSDCATLDTSFVASGPYETGSASGAGTEIDLTIDKIVATWNDEDAVTGLNTQCGAGFFTKGTAKEVNATDCGGQFADFFSTIYTIYKIDGNTLLNGKIDDTNDASSDDKRPTTLDTDSKATKK